MILPQTSAAHPFVKHCTKGLVESLAFREHSGNAGSMNIFSVRFWTVREDLIHKR